MNRHNGNIFHLTGKIGSNIQGKKRSKKRIQIPALKLLLVLVVGIYGSWLVFSAMMLQTREKRPTFEMDPSSKIKVEHDSVNMKMAVEGMLSDEEMRKKNFQTELSDKLAKRRELLERLHSKRPINKILTAYIEGPLKDWVPNQTYDQGGWPQDKESVGMPPLFIEPLPLRSSSTPAALRKFEYPQLRSCKDVPAKIPVDDGLRLDDEGKPLKKIVNNQSPIDDVFVEAKWCPVDADPFLPWLHDFFPSVDGSAIHFVAQNKRRCNTGNRFFADLRRLEPQVALYQPISVKRISELDARNLAPELWNPSDDQPINSISTSATFRYQLVPYEKADDDAKQTRFICRFHTIDPETGIDTILGESLSTFPANYELVNYRKNMPSYASMLTPRGKDNAQFWLSNLRFDCPTPDNDGGILREMIRSGETILEDGTASVWIDLVPIRTSPRFGVPDIYFTEEMAGPRKEWGQGLGDKRNWVRRAKENWDKTHGSDGRKYAVGFDPTRRWGDRNVMPPVEASGRLANLPICRPTRPYGDAQRSSADYDQQPIEQNVVLPPSNGTKPHMLSACLWASASYSTRGNSRVVPDTSSRIIEWIEFHLLVGFDHIYVFDNTGAHTSDVSLESTLYPRFDVKEVTRIDWPSKICNNNVPAHENTGERSSQYAAESSCRQRYGVHSEWLAAFDTDEYLVPMGKYESLKEVVRDAKQKRTNILGFRSVRAMPVRDHHELFYDNKECGKEDKPLCVNKKKDSLFLEAYNCDAEGVPKPDWAKRAKKQIYRPDYVLSHYVHYSTITKGIVRTYAESTAKTSWHRYQEFSPSERFTDESNEAVMVHTKTTIPGDTRKWGERCKLGFVETWKEKCRVGFPWPNNVVVPNQANSEGMAFNCFSNEKVSNVWIPRLREALERRQTRMDNIQRR